MEFFFTHKGSRVHVEAVSNGEVLTSMDIATEALMDGDGRYIWSRTKELIEHMEAYLGVQT